MFNEKCRIVSIFKDYLIYDDDTEEICSLTLETTISCLPEDIKSILTHEQFESMEYKL